MKKKKQGLFALIVLLISGIVLLISAFMFSLTPVSNNDKEKQITVKQGSGISDIAKQLKKEHLIRSQNTFQIYVLLTGNRNLQAGTYTLKENMGITTIVSKLSSGKATNPDEIKLTFKEGINMLEVARIISENTDNSEEDVYNLLKDNDYLDSIIKEYWFLTDDIKNEKIYYSLEGYLYPDTYIVNKKDKVKDIFKVMLDNTNQKLSEVKDEMTDNKYTLHEILTLASMLELESANSDDRNGIAGVLENRLAKGMTLGIDATTYYSLKISMSRQEKLSESELSTCNDYNTRCQTFTGLPVGPICNVSIESIKGVLNPTKHDYYYYIADKNHQTYFTKTYQEHINKKRELESQGLAVG